MNDRGNRWFRYKYSISGGVVMGVRVEPQGFDTVEAAEDHYQSLMAMLPPGYVFTEEDSMPGRSYWVCPKCGGLDTVNAAVSAEGRARVCRACGYRLLIISNRKDLQQLAKMLGVRSDWHEPDEQGLTIRVAGSRFDNCGAWPTGFGEAKRFPEYHIVIERDGEDVAAVNIATLLAIACTP